MEASEEKSLKVTVGVCAYNVEKYIVQCVDSIIHQTHENLEIIIIDDGSTDKTPEILDEYAKNDERIRLVHKKNEGHAAGREQIIGMMTSDLIYWVDSDDWIMSSAIENSLRVMLETGADIVKSPIKDGDRKYTGTYSREEYLKLLLPDLYIKANVIGCLLKKDVYKDVHHRIGFDNEDYYIFPLLADNTHKIVVRDDNDYCYRVVRPGSITYAGRSKFKGFYPRAMHRISRYERYHEEFPEECKVVLSQFADNACMAALYAKRSDIKVNDVLDGMRKLEEPVMNCELIGKYKKWLYRQILKDSILLGPLSILHKIKGNIKTQIHRAKGLG